MASAVSHLGLGALIARVWRIKIARYAIKAGSGLLTVAERILPKDLRR
jgi:small neutral amino acid transporter SnatA (MarC family)